MTRLLVTGASGLLGLNLALEASGLGHEVTGVVNGNRLKGVPFAVLAADLSTPKQVRAVFETARPQAVVHCAALANLEACEADPARAELLNARLPAWMAEESARRDIPLVHISTDAVFDGLRGDYVEEDVPHPLGVYTSTKLAGEQAVASIDPSAIIARVNMYGWSLQGKRSLAEFFFNNLSAGKTVNGFIDVYFAPLLVNDLARLLLHMLAEELTGLYHVVSSESLSKYQFGVNLAHRFGLDAGLITPCSVEDGGLVARRSPNLTLRVDRLARDLGTLPPAQAPMLERFYQLYQQGYPAFLKSLAA